MQIFIHLNFPIPLLVTITSESSSKVSTLNLNLLLPNSEICQLQEQMKVYMARHWKCCAAGASPLRMSLRHEPRMKCTLPAGG